MENEERIVRILCEKFPFLQDRIAVQKAKRIFTKALDRDEFMQVVAFVHDELDFHRGHHVVGTDDGDRLGLLYVLSNSEYILLVLRESVTKENPVVTTLSDLYPNLMMHERELISLFGVVVEGLPPGISYPLADGWPEGNYPMRKEWNPDYFNRNTMTYEPPVEKEEQK